MLKVPHDKQTIMDKFTEIENKLLQARALLHPRPKLRVIQGGKQDGKTA